MIVAAIRGIFRVCKWELPAQNKKIEGAPQNSKPQALLGTPHVFVFFSQFKELFEIVSHFLCLFFYQMATSEIQFIPQMDYLHNIG